jgi:hypothetical protein
LTARPRRSSYRIGNIIPDPATRPAWPRCGIRRTGGPRECPSEMALREFTDRRGVTWKAWDITPESLRELTGGPEYPARHHPELYRNGWLAFQSLSGTERRWLSPIPAGWESIGAPDLADLLERATPGAPGQSRGATAASPSEPPVTTRSAAEESSDPGLVRAFVYPGGRAWTVRVAIPGPGRPTVLRFSSGGRSLDLAKWPSDWRSLADDALIVLLRSVPRTGPARVESAPRRRWNDPAPERPRQRE